jgi:hypothetical protein
LAGQDRGAALLNAPQAVKPDKGAPYWPLNSTPTGHNDPVGLAWGRIYGIEEGWFNYGRGGRLSWSARAVELSEGTAP